MLVIQDNGGGLPSGNNTDELQGFGFMLINILVRQLKGEFKIENQNGVKTVVDFPI